MYRVLLVLHVDRDPFFKAAGVSDLCVKKVGEGGRPSCLDHSRRLVVSREKAVDFVSWVNTAECNHLHDMHVLTLSKGFVILFIISDVDSLRDTASSTLFPKKRRKH